MQLGIVGSGTWASNIDASRLTGKASRECVVFDTDPAGVESVSSAEEVAEGATDLKATYRPAR